MRLITAPGLLPDGPIAILSPASGPADAAEVIAKIIRFAQPGTAVRIIPAGEHPSPDEHVVGYDASAFRRMEAEMAQVSTDTRRRMLDPERAIVMPIPVGAPYSWAGMGASLERGREAFVEETAQQIADSESRDNHPYFGHSIAKHRAYFETMAGRVAEVREALDDEPSREAFDAIVAVDGSRMIEIHLARIYRSVQYFEGLNFDIPLPKILNIGIHTGWELPFLATLMRGRAGTVDCADPMGIAYLDPYVRGFLGGMHQEMGLHPVAVSSYTGTCRLPVTHDGQAIGGANGERMAAHPTQPFPCTTLDDLMRGAGGYSIIKMDTEGGEMDVLWGGINSLPRFRPQMAISIYHDAAHYLDVALWIKRHLPDYRMFVRLYSCTSVETLLYAIPREVEPAAGLLVR